MSNTEPDMNALRKRIAKATASMGRIVKDQTADVKTYTYKYANLNSVMAVVKQALEDENLVLTQPIVTRDGTMIVTTMITCLTTGEYLMFDGPGCAMKADPQAAGSAITYFRRYALTTLFALEADDDDGAMAHRATASPDGRTAAEVEVRKIIAKMDKATRQRFQADFKDEFGVTLSAMSESNHGDALGFAKFWSNEPPVEDTATLTEEGTPA